MGSPVVAPSAGHTNGVAVHPTIQKLTKANEETWLLIGKGVIQQGLVFDISHVFRCALGSVAESFGDLERALSAYENALRHNPHSVSGLTQVAGIARIRENYPKVCIADHFPTPSFLRLTAAHG